MSESQLKDTLLPDDTAQAFLRRVHIRNYKSIGRCCVDLRPLTVLVGRNGSGKSNFLDALLFVADGLNTSLDHAIKSRGGIDAVRRRSTGHPRNFAIQLDMILPEWRVATYGFEVAARPKGGFIIKREWLQVRANDGSVLAGYEVREGDLVGQTSQTMPPSVSDRLYLITAAGLPTFRGAFDALSSMGIYNLNPEAMKELQSPDAGELLHRDGSNIASVIARLNADEPSKTKRINEYLATVVPDITVNRVSIGPRETIEFRQKVRGAKHPWKFCAASMSDGTLRVLGALVAVTQLAERKNPISLVGIEEPETALHPAAAGSLIEALREATADTQILVTTHSPDLLDQIDDVTQLLVVNSREGNTEIAEVDPASRDAIKDHLYLPGDLLRMDQLEPDPAHLDRQRQMRLFDTDEDE